MGDLYIDPILGSDSNDGFSLSAPIKSFNILKNKLANLVTNNAIFKDITIVARSGRIEVPPNSFLTTEHTNATDTNVDILSETDIVFGDYEKSVNAKYKNIVQWLHDDLNVSMTPESEWLFSDNEISKNGIHSIVDNPLGYNPLFIVNPNNGNMIKSAKSWNEEQMMPRNQNYHVELDENNNLSLKVDDDIAKKLELLSDTEISETRVYLKSWWFNTWHVSGISFNRDSGILSFNTSTTNPMLYDGFSYFCHDHAPYFIENARIFLKEDDFCSSTTKITLPQNLKEAIVFKRGPNGLTFDGCHGHTVKISFKYFHPNGVDYFDTNNYAFDASNSEEVRFKNVDMKNNYGHAILISTVGGEVSNSNFLNTGRSCIKASRNAKNSQILKNISDNNGYAQCGDVSIYVTGSELNIEKNKITNFGNFGAIRTDAMTVRSSEKRSSKIIYNICIGLGATNGKRDELKMASDAGIITVNGRVGNLVNASISRNIMINAYGYKVVRGFFGDDGCSGVTFTKNLIFGTESRAIDIRRVSSDDSETNTNDVTFNLVIGRLKLQSLNSSLIGNYFEDRGLISSSVKNENNIDLSGEVTFSSGDNKIVKKEGNKIYYSDASLHDFIKQHLPIESRKYLYLVDSLN